MSEARMPPFWLDAFAGFRLRAMRFLDAFVGARLRAMLFRAPEQEHRPRADSYRATASLWHSAKAGVQSWKFQ